MPLSHTWIITDSSGIVSAFTTETAPTINLDTIALAHNPGGCGIFPIGFDYVHTVTDECGAVSDETRGSVERCYVYGSDGTPLICDGEPFCLDPGTCNCGA